MPHVDGKKLERYVDTVKYPLDVFSIDWRCVQVTICRDEFKMLCSVGGLYSVIHHQKITKVRLTRPIEASTQRAEEENQILLDSRGNLPLENLRRYLDGRKNIQRVYVMESVQIDLEGTDTERIFQNSKTGLWYWRHKNDLSESWRRVVARSYD